VALLFELALDAREVQLVVLTQFNTLLVHALHPGDKIVCGIAQRVVQGYATVWG
jgi:hypothetical protein